MNTMILFVIIVLYKISTIIVQAVPDPVYLIWNMLC